MTPFPLAAHCLLLAATVAVPAYGAMPTKLSAQGLFELAGGGEVIHLPAHSSTPFDAVIVTRSPERCATLERALVDVERYPELWPAIRRVHVMERSANVVRYQIEVALPLAPRLEGVVEQPAPGSVIFHDVETGGRFTYQLHDVGTGCQVRYRLQQPKGRQSGFVRLVTAVDDSAADTAEISGALAALRGVVRPEHQASDRDERSRAGVVTWRRLSSSGTAFKTLHRPGKHLAFVGARRIATPVDVVVATLRDRASYAARTGNVRGVSRADDDRLEWGFKLFGRNIDVDTAVVESGDPRSSAGLTITERVVGGDLREGLWRWTVRAVEGGTEVALFMDLDVARGSAVLSGFASQHDAIGSAVSMQLFLSLIGRVVRGAPLGEERLEEGLLASGGRNDNER